MSIQYSLHRVFLHKRKNYKYNNLLNYMVLFIVTFINNKIKHSRYCRVKNRRKIEPENEKYCSIFCVALSLLCAQQSTDFRLLRCCLNERKKSDRIVIQTFGSAEYSFGCIHLATFISRMFPLSTPRAAAHHPCIASAEN